jgi:hypothetical protein
VRILILFTAAALAVSSLPLQAQDVSAGEDAEQVAQRFAEKLSDPDTQQRLTQAVATMSEALLDLPVAPFMRAAAEMAGEDPEEVDPGLTLRQMSPEAYRVPEEVADKLPRMMGAMAGMAGGMGAMVPALREMAQRMEESIDRAEQPAD